MLRVQLRWYYSNEMSKNRKLENRSENLSEIWAPEVVFLRSFNHLGDSKFVYKFQNMPRWRTQLLHFLRFY